MPWPRSGADAADLLISADEEVGSATSQALIEERAVACGHVLVLEPAAEGGGVKTGRKGVGTFTIEVTGRAAHAGLEPDRGVNALVEAAHQLLAAAAIADPAAGTTITPTLASAGTAENVVPAHATVRLDVRVTSLDEARRVERALAALPTNDPAAAVAIIGGVHRPPLPESATAQLFALARDVSASLGVARARRGERRRGERRQLHRRPRHPDARRPRRRRRRRPRRPRMGRRGVDAGASRSGRRPRRAAGARPAAPR